MSLRASIVLVLALAGCGAGLPSNRHVPSAVGLPAKTDGVLVKLPKDGARVTAGEVVAELQSSRATIALENATDALVRAERSHDAARIASARIDRDRAAQELDDLQIRTPIDGVVANRAVRVGQPIGAGAVVVAILRTP